MEQCVRACITVAAAHPIAPGSGSGVCAFRIQLRQRRDALKIRTFQKGDAASLTALVRALADYEKLPHPTPAAARRLIADIGRRIHVLIAEVDGQAVGYAIYLYTYSSFRARPKLYLEDLFVLPEHRRAGLGARFFGELRKVARRAGCGRMEWIVLDWNKSARRFYAKLGAKPQSGWSLYKLDLGR